MNGNYLLSYMQFPHNSRYPVLWREAGWPLKGLGAPGEIYLDCDGLGLFGCLGVVFGQPLVPQRPLPLYKGLPVFSSLPSLHFFSSHVSFLCDGPNQKERRKKLHSIYLGDSQTEERNMGREEKKRRERREDRKTLIKGQEALGHQWLPQRREKTTPKQPNRPRPSQYAHIITNVTRTWQCIGI